MVQSCLRTSMLRVHQEDFSMHMEALVHLWGYHWYPAKQCDSHSTRNGYNIGKQYSSIHSYAYGNRGSTW